MIVLLLACSSGISRPSTPQDSLGETANLDTGVLQGCDEGQELVQAEPLVNPERLPEFTCEDDLGLPVVQPGGYVEMGERWLSARGYPEWKPERSVHWGEADDAHATVSDCLLINPSFSGPKTAHLTFRDPDGSVVAERTLSFVVTDGEVLAQPVLLPEGGGPETQGLWVTSEGLAKLESGVLRIAPLPFAGDWGAPLVEDGPIRVHPLETEDGLQWLLGYAGEGLYRYRDGEKAKLTSTTRAEGWQLVGDLTGDGTSEISTECGLIDPLNDALVHTAWGTDQDGILTRVKLRSAQTGDFNGDGVVDLALGSYGLSWWVNGSDNTEVALLLGPHEPVLDLDAASTTFDAGWPAPDLQLLSADLDQDGLSDVVYPVISHFHAAIALKGAAQPTWDQAVYFNGTSHPDGRWIDANEAQVLLGGEGTGYGVAWVILLPRIDGGGVENEARIHLVAGTHELVIWAPQLGDLDGDGQDEIFGLGPDGVWWVP